MVAFEEKNETKILQLQISFMFISRPDKKIIAGKNGKFCVIRMKNGEENNDNSIIFFYKFRQHKFNEKTKN